MGMEHDWNAFLRSLEGTKNASLKVAKIAQVGTWHEVRMHVHQKTAVLHVMPTEPDFFITYDDESRQVAVSLALYIGIPTDRFSEVQEAMSANHPQNTYVQFAIVVSEHGMVLSTRVKFDLPELVEEDLQTFTRDEILRTAEGVYWKWFTMSQTIHASLGLQPESPPTLRH